MTSSFLLLLSCFFFCELAAAQCLPEERAALLEVKRGFSVPSAAALSSWKPGTDCCRWDGVDCDPASGRVAAVDLSGHAISGEIDESLFNLTSLAALNLAYNGFENITLARLPFDRLADLTSLNLSNAGFVGQVPASIGRLTKLVSLDLSTFYLDVLPSSSLRLIDPDLRTLLRNLSNLKVLVLDGVNISASGREWSSAVAASTPGLQVLSLVGCSLSGPIDSSLAGLRSLSKLRLDQNALNSSVPEFIGNLSSLRVLRLLSCGLRGWFPASIFLLPNLTLLDLSNNLNLSGQLPEFPEDSAFESLVLTSTNFSGDLPESIGNLRNLAKLDLWGCKFHGLLPASIANLTQLVHLDLSFNNFSGEIPQDVHWPRISEIVLAHNTLTGQIPSSFGNGGFHKLSKIDMRNNALSGSIPGSFFALQSLQSLELKQNHLSGALEFSNASSSLVIIDLSSNRLQGPVPNSLFELSGLKVLSLADNSFNGTLAMDQFRRLKNLTNLDLSNNRFSLADEVDNSSLDHFPRFSSLKLVSCNLKKIPSFLKNQDKMNGLDLSSNMIEGIIPSWIWSIGNGGLAYLNLSHNMFIAVERLPLQISQFSSMILDLHANKLQGPIPLPPQNTIVLDYSENNFSSSIPANLSWYLNFTFLLSLSKNQLTGQIPDSICKATYLKVLDLSYNNLNGSIPPCLLGSSKDLGVLNLRGNDLHGMLPQNVNKSCSLHTINLNDNHLEGSLPGSLVNCTSLEVLDLGNNEFNDSFPFWLKDLPELRVLVLRSNRLHGTLDLGNTICTGPMLQIFDVSFNNFTGNLPTECFKNMNGMILGSDVDNQTVGFQYLYYNQPSYQNTITVTNKGLDMTLVKILTVFTSIDVSNNRFTGVIPEEIGKLNLLYGLNMSHNAFTGEIPPQLGNLSQLESLDLSSNLLSGEIPLELTKLTFLSFLNLSFNNLVGRIPLAGQFHTFSSSSFEGNNGLCGPPSPKPCTSESADPPGSKVSASRALTELNWRCIFIGLGFGLGLAVTIGPVTMWGTGRKWYNKHVDRMLLVLIPQWVYENCGDVKVSAEDAESDSLEMEESDSLEMENEGRRFCVFCTRLEISNEQAIVRHVDCSCPRLAQSCDLVSTELNKEK